VTREQVSQTASEYTQSEQAPTPEAPQAEKAVDVVAPVVSINKNKVVNSTVKEPKIVVHFC
jgi:hypothetical protein